MLALTVPVVGTPAAASTSKQRALSVAMATTSGAFCAMRMPSSAKRADADARSAAGWSPPGISTSAPAARHSLRTLAT